MERWKATTPKPNDPAGVDRNNFSPKQGIDWQFFVLFDRIYGESERFWHHLQLIEQLNTCTNSAHGCCWLEYFQKDQHQLMESAPLMITQDGSCIRLCKKLKQHAQNNILAMHTAIYPVQLSGSLKLELIIVLNR